MFAMLIFLAIAIVIWRVIGYLANDSLLAKLRDRILSKIKGVLRI